MVADAARIGRMRDASTTKTKPPEQSAPRVSVFQFEQSCFSCLGFERSVIDGGL